MHLNPSKSRQDRLYGVFGQISGNLETISSNTHGLMELPSGNYGIDGGVCPSCGEFKEWSKFTINRSRKTGYTKYCKACIEFDKPKQMPKQKRNCSECGEDITNKTFSAKTCSKKCGLLRSNRNSKGNQFLIFNRDGCRCQYCGRTPADDDVKIVCDHIVPLVHGGGHTAGNLVTACFGCNSAKSSHPISKDTMDLIINSVTRKNIQFNIHPQKIITGSHCRNVVSKSNEQANSRKAEAQTTPRTVGE